MSWKQIPRRAFLQGSGVMIGLPILEAMFPMRQALAQATVAPLRTVVVNFPFGTTATGLAVGGSGANYTLPTPWSSLTAYKPSMTAVRRIFNHWGNVDADGDHARGQGSYLTCMHLNKSETVIRNGISMDQVIANQIGSQTRVPSAFFSGERGFGGDSGYSSLYMNLSWKNSTTPSTLLGDPHNVFDTLLAGLGGGANQNQATLLRLRKRKSILDGAVADSNRLLGILGTTDKQKLDQFLTSVREVETSIARDIANTGTGPVCAPGTRPQTNLNFQTRVTQFFNLMVLAMQCDATRTFVYHIGSPYDFGPINGVSGDHHNEYSHHNNEPARVDGMLKIATWYAEQFAVFMAKMNTTMDVDGKSLLYNSIVTYGAEICDSNAHSDYDIPMLVSGNAGGKFTPGKVINTGQDIPMANVWLTIMKAAGVNINTFGEGPGISTGTVAL